MENILKVKIWYIKKQDLEAFLDGDRVESKFQMTDEMKKNIKQALYDIKEESKGK